jgi:MSHA biogenesis protein MshJ
VAITIKAQAAKWIDRIDAMELRERVLLLAATIVVLFLIVDSFALEPTLKAQQITEQRMTELELKLGGLRQQASLLSLQTDENPLASLHESRDNLASQLAELDNRILGQLGALVEPAQAAEMLEQVLSGHRGLKLTSLEASSEPLGESDVPQHAAGGLGRYQLQLVVEGAYLDLLSYLEELEAMPWKVFWQKADLQVAEYPRAVTRLQLYTLGALDG